MDKVCVTFNYGKCSNRREGDLLEGGGMASCYGIFVSDEGRARYFEKNLALEDLLEIISLPPKEDRRTS